MGAAGEVKLVFHPDEDNTGAGVRGCEKELGKVQILRDHDPSAFSRPSEKIRVRRVVPADGRPVAGFPAVFREGWDPVGAEIHVQ